MLSRQSSSHSVSASPSRIPSPLNASDEADSAGERMIRCYDADDDKLLHSDNHLRQIALIHVLLKQN